MNLHEYQSKKLFSKYKLPVSKGYVAHDINQVIEIIEKNKESAWVLKAQIHSGNRGKSGGIKITKDKKEIINFSKNILGKYLSTSQTEKQGKLVTKILIEPYIKIIKEFYLSLLIDQEKSQIMFIFSTEGGMDIEYISKKYPDKIYKTFIDPFIGAQKYQAKNISYKLGFNVIQSDQFSKIFLNLYKMFLEKDISLIEINPLIINEQGNLYCLDAKISLDENALYRHLDMKNLRDRTQENPIESHAKNFGLHYISLDGNIACIVNGAGLAMATMDTIKSYGGNPANFLDIGGNVNANQLFEAFKIIISDQKVKGIFVNIFGGIVCCNMIAESILFALKNLNIKIPILVRLKGNNSTLGMNKLNASHFNIILSNELDDGAKEIIEMVNKS